MVVYYADSNHNYSTREQHDMVWQIDIHPAAGHLDRDGRRVRDQIAELGLGDSIEVQFARSFLLAGSIDQANVQQLANTLLVDPVTERSVIGICGEAVLSQPLLVASEPTLVHVLPKPGVMDPVAVSTQRAARDAGFSVDRVRTMRKYWLTTRTPELLQKICKRVLANEAIEQTVIGPLRLNSLELGHPYQFQLVTIPLRKLTDEGLIQLSRQGQLYLTLVEMQTIQQHFCKLGRDPTDIELESLAQTWSEHCSHKTLAGKIDYEGPEGKRHFANLLKETVFAATVKLRQRFGKEDWCVSVFKDNAGIIRFDDQYNVCFKVETHNHPSALEPYGGANTGVGGVIRDPMGTGLGAKPVCNTDVFCFAPPDMDAAEIPAGVLHPRRVIKGVVSGVRDYGNRMGIPTVNGAVYFDRRYLGNPLVYCGNVGIIPCSMSFKEPKPHDLIVALGGRTGRDGIHGATFSSAELTSESETESGGAVQIGNAITEKMVLDVLLQARDRGLYNAVTDCGAGGFSSAVGEMGESIGAEVWLDRAPLKYEGLSYTEIWISEAQERMVLAVPVEKWETLRELCHSEGVEATAIGQFKPTGRLKLLYQGHEVGDLSMEFLHEGRPPVVRKASYVLPPTQPLNLPKLSLEESTDTLKKILACWNVASKHWIIRQYDHEVQGGSAIKPLVGVREAGPSDAAVVRPRLESRRGLVISCGMNPRLGDLDTYAMAASAIDEAIRNAVAVGADPSRIAILDNFCWGYTDREETLGSLVRAALACYDLAVAMETPFISGKDSLNNEFSYQDPSGQKQSIAIPPSLLISALGQVDDVNHCVTMDLKGAGNRLYLIGVTEDELGGSHFSLVHELAGGSVPQVNPERAKETFAAVHRAIRSGIVRACHDLSEGGLAVAAAEMAFAGGLGINLDIEPLAQNGCSPLAALFSESNSRFLVEVAEEQVEEFTKMMTGICAHCLGKVTDEDRVHIRYRQQSCISATIEELERVWQAPLDW
jgi:phosphoribosylformylglycinamidine synthase